MLKICLLIVLCCCSLWPSSVCGLLLSPLAFSGIKLANFPISASLMTTPSWGLTKRGLTKEHTLPWSAVGKPLSCDWDITHYANTLRTASRNKTNAVLMNIETWENIPINKRPLEGRLNIIVSKSPHYTQSFPNLMNAPTLIDAIDMIEAHPIWGKKIERAIVIGGANLFNQCIWHPSLDTIDMVQTVEDFPADEYLLPTSKRKMDFIEFNRHHVEDKEENGVKYKLITYIEPKLYSKSEPPSTFNDNMRSRGTEQQFTGPVIGSRGLYT